ncbi:facilitated trehalose transporter Tret1-2 homolog isoform X2 [Venturia canescens]|nr:facilitated trehalose transporter Tret1-2 homolog isoform X2 [Venturia canescens]
MFSFSIGTTIGWVSPTIVKLLEPDSPIPFTPDDISTMVAASAVGHVISPPLNHFFVDRIGRRNTLLLSGLPVIISSAMIMVARHIWVIHVARILVGFSLGMCLCVSPMYMGEVASIRTRGLAGASIGVMINLGILFTYVVCPYLSIASVGGLLMIIALGFVFAFWFMPESPHYLAMVGRIEEAEAVLEKLRGRMDVSEELKVLKDAVPKSAGERSSEKGRQNRASWRDVFTGRGNRRALLIAFLFLLPQHFGGYFLVLAYNELIFKNAGMAIPSHWATIAVGISQLLSAVISGLLVDKLGRRPLILGAGLTAGLCNAVMGGYLFAQEYVGVDVEPYSVLFLLAVLVQVFFFNFGLLSIHLVIMAEVFNTEVKGVAMSIVGVCSAVFGIISSKFYITIAVTWAVGHSVPFLAFAFVVWVSTILLVMITPETKGRSFVQIQLDLNR